MARKATPLEASPIEASPMERENWPDLRLAADEMPDDADWVAAFSIQPEIQPEKFKAVPAKSKVALATRFDAAFDSSFDVTSFPSDSLDDYTAHIRASAGKWIL